MGKRGYKKHKNQSSRGTNSVYIFMDSETFYLTDLVEH